MTDNRLISHSDGMEIDWGALGAREDRDLALLAVAEREHLLEHVATLPDGHYAVLCNGVRLVLTSEEVPGFVLGTVVAAGKPTAVVSYRRGIRSS